MDRWVGSVEAERLEREEFVAAIPESPLSAEPRSLLDGLSYYPVRPKYRFELTFDEFSDKEAIVAKTTRGNERFYVRWGEFVFEIDGREHRLTAFVSLHEKSESLWVPFRDETNGDTTDEVGRYLEIDESDRRGDEVFVLDFNQAFHPSCVHVDGHECSLVPPENDLNVRIEAGERSR